jgi:hypothetical protein
MPNSSDTADLEAYRLMRAGNFRAALPFAERAVSGKRTCVPAHGMLATSRICKAWWMRFAATVSRCHLMFDSGDGRELIKRQQTPVGPTG